MKIILEVKTLPRRTVPRLIDELGVSKSQYYKDKDTLAEMGFVFGYDRKLGKLVIHQDSTLPIGNLSLSEQLALIMALRHLSAAGDYTLTYEGFNAARKLAMELPEPFMESIFDDLVLKEGFGCKPKIMEAIQTAIEKSYQVELLYQRPEQDEPRSEVMDPYHLFFRRRAMYVEGYSWTEDAIRTYRIQRIHQVTFKSREFAIKEGYDFGKRYRNAFSAYGGETTEHVTILFNREIRPFIEESMWHHTQKTTRQSDGSIIFEVDVYYPREVMWWSFRWRAGAEILEPEWLREEAIQNLKDMCKVYEMSVAN